MKEINIARVLSSCFVAPGDADSALQLLEKTEASSLDTETLSDAAYQMIGKTDKAKSVIQS